METSSYRRLTNSLAAFFAAGGVTILLGSPIEAALPAAFLGGLLAWATLGDSLPPAPAATAPASPDRFASALPVIAAILDAMDQPVLLVDRQTIRLANPAARRQLGAHIIGENVRLAIRHPDAAELLVGDIPDQGEATISVTGIGGPDRRWDLAVHPIDAERRLVRLADRTDALAAERMRVDFVANASHELRTPLATIIGFVETLQDPQAGADAATRDRFLGIIADESRRMARLVDDLISLSRIEGEKFAPLAKTVPLGALLAEVSDAIRDPRIAIEAEPELLLRGDHAQLSQLLHNLIGNAIKYGRPGTPVRVTAARADSDRIRITIADQGEGIAPEHLPRLTERFYRVDAGRSRALGGTGLGLAIVKHIVERHRGKLEITSVPDVGTTVTVLLPAAVTQV